MKPWMKHALKMGSAALVTAVMVLAWLVYFHNDWILSKSPQWAQGAISHLGKKVDAPVAADDDDPDNTKNEIPVKVAAVTRGTVRTYIEGYGQVVPRPAEEGQMAGGASIAAPVAGIVAKVDCRIGQKVKTGDLLVELDSRLARAALDQAQATLAEAQASLEALKATPRPEQLDIAQLAVEKAQSGADLAQQNYDREKALTTEQVASAKTLEQAASDLAGAKNDLAVARQQLALLKASCPRRRKSRKVMPRCTRPRRHWPPRRRSCRC